MPLNTNRVHWSNTTTLKQATQQSIQLTIKNMWICPLTIRNTILADWTVEQMSDCQRLHTRFCNFEQIKKAVIYFYILYWVLTGIRWKHAPQELYDIWQKKAFQDSWWDKNLFLNGLILLTMKLYKFYDFLQTISAIIPPSFLLPRMPFIIAALQTFCWLAES